MPASNMKNFTIATAMEKLGPDFKFVTRVFAACGAGRERHDQGRPEDSRRRRYFDLDGIFWHFTDRPRDILQRHRPAGRRDRGGRRKKIDGNIIGDESHFKGFAIPPTWEWDDLQWYYGAEVSALPINDNAVDLSVMPGAVGSPCVVNISAGTATSLYQIINTCTTTAANLKRTLGVNKKIDRNILEISGTLPVGRQRF